MSEWPDFRHVRLYPCERITHNGWPEAGAVHVPGDCEWCGDGRDNDPKSDMDRIAAELRALPDVIREHVLNEFR